MHALDACQVLFCNGTTFHINLFRRRRVEEAPDIRQRVITVRTCPLHLLPKRTITVPVTTVKLVGLDSVVWKLLDRRSPYVPVVRKPHAKRRIHQNISFKYRFQISDDCVLLPEELFQIPHKMPSTSHIIWFFHRVVDETSYC